jgi:hypothetical protein
LLDAALAVPFDPEEEDRRQLALARQATWDQGAVTPSVVDIAPEPAFVPDPLVAEADAAMGLPPAPVSDELEPALPTEDGGSGGPALPQADEDLPPVQPPGAGSMGQGATAGAGDGAATGGRTRRSASALLADIPDPLPPVPTNVEGRSVLSEIGNAFQRGWTMGDLAREMEAPAPNADRVFALQQEMQKLPPSPEYVTTMRDDVAPAESWQAFKSNPVGVLGEMMGESLAAFGNQMIEKAPNRVAIGLGAGAAMGAPLAGIGAVPGGFMGAGAGFAQSSGAASYALEMSSGILEGLERAGVPMDDPAAMRAALADPERMKLAREFAQRKAVPIAIFDGGSALMAGRLGGQPASALAKVGQGFAETFLQGAMGAAGEASGQLAQSGEIRSGRAILAEGVAELPTGLAEIGVGALTQNAADANRPEAAAAAAGVKRSASAVLDAAVPDTAPNAGPTAPVRRVVVEADDVFGEATTAVVEEPAAAAAAGDERFAPAPAAEQRPAEPAGPTGEDLFGEVEQRGETIVTPAPGAAETAAATGETASGVDEATNQNYGGTNDTGISQAAGGGNAPSTAQSAADFTRSRSQAIRGASPGRKEFAAEFEALLEWGQQQNLVSNSPPVRGRPDSKGREHEVWLDPQRARVFKATYPQQFGLALSADGKATPAQYMERIELNNRFFGDDIRLEQLWNDGGRLRVVTSQPAVEAPAASDADIEAFFADLGFEKVHRGEREFFYNPSEQVIAYDAHRGNVLNDNGKILPIDVGMQRVTPELAAALELPAAATPSAPSNAPAQAKLNIQRKLRPDSGAVDVSILEDIVEYGKTVYRAGMDLATWSAQMVKEFGQGVAQFLRQAFDRIVAAYRDSRFADTTGAVGDVRPRQTKPRQLEEKAMRNEALAAETRARLGSEYLPISLNAQAEAAKEWINTNGLDAAKLRIAQLSGEDSVPTPLDFAIGIEAAGRLSAVGDHQGAADIVSTMSHRATGMGQTISTLAMMARLSPEGIVFYGENIIRRYINALPPEAQDRIRALQAEVARLKAELAQAKFDQGSEVIRSGKLGDEKIQDRIKRRQRAKVTADLGPAASGPEVTAETRARVISMNRAVRDVLLGDSTKAEATKAIEAILLEQGNLSAAEAAAMAKSIADAFFKLMRETRTRLTNEAKGRGGRAGGFDRLLAALREGKDISDADFLGEISRLMGLPGMTPAMARELRAIGQRYERATDPDVRLVLAAQMYEKAHELVPADFWVKVRGFAYLSMLFAPKTWIRNVVGNQIQWIANVGRDAFVTGLLDPAMSMFTGQRTSAGLQLGARLKGLLAPVADVRRGYLWSKQENPSANHFQNFMAGVNHLRLLSKLSSQNKYEISDVRSVNGRIFSSGFMRSWEAALSIALGAGDRAFWMSQFKASMAQMQAAAEKNGEWSGQPTPEMIEAAMAEAAYAIYQNPNLLSQGGAKLRGVLNRWTTAGRTDQFGLGTALMAFTQVPGSIALRGILDWSPVGFIRAMYQGMRGVLYASSEGRRGAKFDQAEFNKTFTQALLGTGGMYAAGFWLYSLGIITASREDDEDLEAMRRASGLGSYRINLTALRRALLSMNWFTPQPPQDGDMIVTYDWAQPVAITVAAGAEYAAMLERAERSALKKGLTERASMAAMSLVAGAKSLEELPLLSGLMSFMQAAGQRAPAGESSLANAVIKTVTGLPSMFVPQLVRQATQLSDNMVRTTRAGVAAEREFDRVLASLPGWSTKYPVRFDVTGQAIERYQYGGNTVWNVLTNPALTTRYKADPVLQEVGRLLNATGEAGVVPREVLRKTKINGQDVELTNNQIAAYQYYVGNFTMSHFRWRMAAPVYARLPDELKAKMLSDDLKDIHAAVKSAVLGADARRLTRRQMFLRQALVNSPLGRSVPPK